MSTPARLRWAEEFRRYLSIKRLFVFYGNIHDLFPSPVPDPALRGPTHTLGEFIGASLKQAGYQAFGTFDPVDALRLGWPGEPGVRLPEEFPSPPKPCTAFGAFLDYARCALSNGTVPCAFTVGHASLVASSPDHLTEAERQAFLRVFKAAESARTVVVNGVGLNNVLVLLVEKLNDLPVWLYLGNPFVKTIQVDLPDENHRREFFDARLASMHGAGSATLDRAGLVDKYAALTHGLMNRDLEHLVTLSRRERLSVTEPAALVQLYKFGERRSPWATLVEDPVNREQLRDAATALGRRVKGQPAAIAAVTDILKRASLGLSGSQHSSKSSKPKGILFFAGPTGVGKTEMAKAIAELIFADESACLRFDMSEYALEHADQRLFGAPPGYVGYEQGGELTNKVKATPFSVLLFDEIEKAHPKIMDKFLQILEDGRLTSGQGETVHFSETLIIFTSNKGIYDDHRMPDGRIVRQLAVHPNSWRCSRCGTVTCETTIGPCAEPGCGGTGGDVLPTPYEALKTRVLNGLAHFFKQELERPELYNRIGNNFVVFDFIRRDVVGQIVDKMLGGIAADVAARLKVQVDFSLVKPLVVSRASENLDLGARGIGNLIETMIVNPLARTLFDSPPAEGTRLAVTAVEADASGTSYVLTLGQAAASA